MGGGNAPPPPDYGALSVQQAQMQNQQLQQQIAANRPNISNAWGSSSWKQDPTTGQWTNTQALNSGLQGTLDQLMGRLPGELQGLDTSSLTAWGAVPQGDDALRQRTSDAMYQQATSRLDPQWQQAELSKTGQLAAMGLHPGDPAYDQQMQQFNQAKSDAYNQANFSAIQGGNDAFNQSFQQSLAGGQFADQQRAQQIAQQLQQSGWTMNQIQGLLGGLPGTSTPNATAGVGVAPDLAGAAAQGYKDLLKQQDENSNLWGGIAKGITGLAGAVAAPFTGGASLAAASGLMAMGL